jgi:hypothetical protein
MMVAYAGHLSGSYPLNTNKQRGDMMDNMTLASNLKANNCIKLIQLDKERIHNENKSA